MDPAEQKPVIEAARRALPPADFRLLQNIDRFVDHRLQAAREALAGGELLPGRGAPAEPLQREVHRFLQELWAALDGLGREVCICLRGRFPGSGLPAPGQMTPQCTFYTVRRDLHRHGPARRHPLAELLWSRTREPSTEPYERLSFLYNLSLFVAVPLPGGTDLPGAGDLPGHLAGLVRPQEVERTPLAEGLGRMLEWAEELRGECEAEMKADFEARER